MKRNRLVTILAIVTIIATLSISSFFAQLPVTAGYNASSMPVEGVLASDNYVLFPFAKKNLKIGFSKYGEMIDGITKTGLAYDGYDAFAPPSGVVEWQWVEGWILNITYVQGGNYKNVWAMATYSDYYDSAGIGGPWHENVTCGSLGLDVRGGRKTSGGAVTDPIKVLYDGPRKFVALLNTTIYAEPEHTTPLVKMTFTIIFNKVKKQVVIFKDIKRIDIGKNIGPMQIEFGDRGEWDLGAGTPPKSYAHFFENQSTVYNHDYQSWYNTTVGNYDGTYDVCQVIDDDLTYVGWAAFWPKPIVSWVGATQEEASRDFILVSTSTKTEVHKLTDSTQSFTLVETPADYPQKNATGIFWVEDPMVFVNDVHKIINGSDASTMVYYFRGNNTVKFPAGYIPGAGDTVKIVYKVAKYHKDMSAEPNSPFVIGEWAWQTYESGEMFRGVTVYGITDLNNGDDADRTGGANVLDTEVQYYLNETFNPYDLYSAVEKNTRRWVEFTFGPTWTSHHKPVKDVSDNQWDQYSVFSERVIDLNTSTLLNRRKGDYTFWVDTSGYGHISGLESDHYYKVLYSTNTSYTNWGNIDKIWLKNDTFNKAGVTFSETSFNYTIIDPLGANHTLYIPDLGFTVTNKTTITEDHTYKTFIGTMDFYTEDFKVFRGSTNVIDCYWWDQLGPHGGRVFRHVDDDGTLQVNFTTFHMQWYITPPADESLHVDWLHLDVDYNITVVYDSTANTYNTTAHFNVNGNGGTDLLGTVGTWTNQLYVEHIGGRYEWIVVGKNAATIDSLGAAYMTEAFDSKKQIHVQIAGMDINDTVLGPHAPFVMGGAVTGTRTDYYYNYPTDNRTGLRDDWCYTYPVSSSNMLFSGGPRANLGTEYFNEFTNAFFAEAEYVVNNTGQANKILALTCWARNTYGAGYAVISVYKDLNGTIGFLIWGYNGEDTYYAAKWFWDIPGGITAPDGTTVYSGIEYLQHENRGVTDIILHIDYTTCPYSVGIVSGERLGTISEKGQHDCSVPWWQK